jgi:hypothetical protein
MAKKHITRRQFIQSAAASAGVALASGVPGYPVAPKTAADPVTLGRTGIKLSRLGIGTGTNGGNVQRGLGREKFNDLIHYAYDRGIRYIDTADSYQTHTWVRDAIKLLPREKLYIQSKMTGMGMFGNSANPMETLDRFRRELNVDYIDTVLIHCQISPNWDEESKPLREALEEAKQKGIIRAHGVSCHSLPATIKAASLNSGAHQPTGRQHRHAGTGRLREKQSIPCSGCYGATPNYAEKRPRHHRDETDRRRPVYRYRGSQKVSEMGNAVRSCRCGCDRPQKQRGSRRGNSKYKQRVLMTRAA